MRKKASYVAPKVLTIEARQIVTALGPVSAGSPHSPGNPNGWMDDEGCD
jgi:hypothetical protein